MRYEYDDGGREAAGFVGKTRDCTTRAIAIATGKPYQEVYNDLTRLNKVSTGLSSGARNGVPRKVYQPYLEALGFLWVPTMEIGTGCTMHLDASELPSATLVARLSRHLCAVVDGAVRDTHDPRREGTRCVYGYFIHESSPTVVTIDPRVKIVDIR